MYKQKTNLINLLIFSLSMGFLESIVVIYLRHIYYPEGFYFPLKILPLYDLRFEYLREASTIIMLTCISMIAGGIFFERFAYFLFCFGLWDIFYYIGLKLLIDWPSSLFSWDVLFLIPFVWLAPVVAPIICATIMVVLSFIILYSLRKNENRIIINKIDASLFIIGASLIFLSFIWDTMNFILTYNIFKKPYINKFIFEYQNYLRDFIPSTFRWDFYLMGIILILLSSTLFFIRQYKHNVT